MPTYSRTGRRVGGFKLGRWQCLRQELLHPGERIRPGINGFIRLGALRQQLIQPVHVTLFVAATPVRWFEQNIVDMVKDGPKSVDTFTDASVAGNWDSLGLGFLHTNPPRFFQRNWNAVYNWHLKWPEDADRSLDAGPLSETEQQWGPQAVNLESGATRVLNADLVTAGDKEFETEASGAREKFDIAQLAQFMAELRGVREREWTARDRYREILQDIYNARGDRGETEQIPIVLDEVRQSLQAEEIWATDGGNLGAIAGVMQGTVDYSMDYEFVAPEHTILSYWMALRLPPVWDRGKSPWCDHDTFTWAERVADPTVLANQEPQQRTARYYVGNQSANVGYEPSGHMWRYGWSCVDQVVTNLGNYLFHMGLPATADILRKHPNVGAAFVSQAIGDGLFSLDFQQTSESNVPLPMSGVMAGT